VAFSLIVDGPQQEQQRQHQKKEKIMFIWLWPRFVAHTQRMTPYVTISSSGRPGICWFSVFRLGAFI